MIDILVGLLVLCLRTGQASPHDVRIIYDPADVQEVQFLYSGDTSRWYAIGSLRYAGPKPTHQDTFYWVFPTAQWRNGMVRAIFQSGKMTREEEIEIGVDPDELVTPTGCHHGVDTMRAEVSLPIQPSSSAKGDQYAWRTFQNDAQHTGRYPYSLHPPLELRWTYTGQTGADFQMISGCAANGMLYVGGGTYGGHELAKIKALDVETGELVWERLLTSNVWTAALSPGDSLLFVGTSIEPSLTKPTFFCLDASTGEVRWSKMLYTVQFQPIAVGERVYVSTLTSGTSALSMADGQEIWIDSTGTGGSPAYWNGKLFARRKGPALVAYDALTGDTIWVFSTPGRVDSDPVIYDGVVYFFSYGRLYALAADTGELDWWNQVYPEPGGPFYSPVSHGGRLFVGWGRYGPDSLIYGGVHCFDSNTGGELWQSGLLHGSRVSHMILSGDDYLWITNQYVHALKMEGGDTVYCNRAPGELTWPAWFWPIQYGDYLIGAHREALYVFKGDTTPPPDTLPYFSVYPNPFTNKTTVRIVLSEESPVRFYVYDLCGRLVSSVDVGVKSPGVHLLEWNGDTDRGGKSSSGLYFMKLEKKGCKRTQTAKLIYFRR